MTCSTSVQIYKNYEGQQAFFFKGPKRANQLSFQRRDFSGFSLTIIPLQNSISFLILGAIV
jgi:hypothetical protein